MCCSIDENDISAVFDFVSDTPSTILETDIFEIMIDRCSEAKPRLPNDTPAKIYVPMQSSSNWSSDARQVRQGRSTLCMYVVIPWTMLKRSMPHRRHHFSLPIRRPCSHLHAKAACPGRKLANHGYFCGRMYSNICVHASAKIRCSDGANYKQPARHWPP